MSDMVKKSNREWIKDLPDAMRTVLEEEFRAKGNPGCGLLDEESLSLVLAMKHLRHNSSGSRCYFWHGVGVKAGWWGDGKNSQYPYQRFWYNEVLNREGYDFAESCGL